MNVLSTRDLNLVQRYVDYTRKYADPIQSPGLLEQMPVGCVMLETEEDLRNLAIEKIDPTCGSARTRHF